MMLRALLRWLIPTLLWSSVPVLWPARPVEAQTNTPVEQPVARPSRP